MQAPAGEELPRQEGGPQVMGLIIKAYLFCAVCCTSCCVVGAVVLLVEGQQCLADVSDGCSTVSAITMLVFGALPPVAAMSAAFYLQADARGWFRPHYVAPGGHGQRRKLRFEEELEPGSRV